MNMKQLVLVSLLFGSTAIPLSAERKKTTHATKTEQNWWQRRSPEFKAFVITVGTITGVCLMRYGWVKGMQWLEAKRAARQARSDSWHHYERSYDPDEHSYTNDNTYTFSSRRENPTVWLDEEVEDLQRRFFAQLSRTRSEMQRTNSRHQTAFHIAPMGSLTDTTELQTFNYEIPSEVLDTYTHSFSGTSGWDTRNGVSSSVRANLSSDAIAQIRQEINEGAQCPVCLEGKEDELADDNLNWCNKCHKFICTACKQSLKNNMTGCPLSRCSYYEL